MVQLSNEQLMRILLEDDEARCKECGSTGAHYCPGKPQGNDWLDFKAEIDARKLEDAMTIRQEMEAGLDDNLVD